MMNFRKNKTKIIIILILLVFATRIPYLLMMKDNYNDPGRDGAVYVNGAHNINAGNGYKIDFLLNFHKNKELNSNKISHPGYHYPPVYPGFIALVFFIKDSLFAIGFANVLLFVLTIIVLYFLFVKIFGDKIALISIVLLIFNPTLFHYSTCILSEMLYLTLSSLTFYFLLTKKNKIEFIIISGFLAGMTFLCRYVGIFVIISGFIWLITYKRYKKGLIFGTASFITLAPWFLFRNYFIYGDALVRLHRTFEFQPAIHATTTSIIHAIFSNVQGIIKDFILLAADMSSIDFFHLLLPFIIMGCFLYLKDKRLSLPIIFLFTVIIGHIIFLRHSITRYYIATIIFLIPIGVKAMSEFLSSHDDINMGFKSNKSKLFMILVLCLLLVYSGGIIKHVYSTRQLSKQEVYKYVWLNENASSNSIVAAVFPQRVNYYTGLKSVMFPTNLDKDLLSKYIEYYNISYFALKWIGKYSNNKYIMNTFFSGEKTEEIKDYKLALIHEDIDSGNKILIYKVMK